MNKALMRSNYINRELQLIVVKGLEYYKRTVTQGQLNYRVFQKELYNYESLHKFIQRACTMF
jgi:hypothetical protein